MVLAGWGSAKPSGGLPPGSDWWTGQGRRKSTILLIGIYIYTHDHICLYINHLCLWAMASIAMEQIARGGSVVITENGGSSTWNVPVFASHFFWGIWTGLHRESLKHGGQNHRAWEDGGFQHSSGWKINAWIITEYVLYKISTEYVLYITVLRILVTAPVLLGSKGQS